MGRGDLSDAEWELIGPLLPPERGRRVARRISFTTLSAVALGFEDLGLIFVPSSLRPDPNPP